MNHVYHEGKRFTIFNWVYFEVRVILKNATDFPCAAVGRNTIKVNAYAGPELSDVIG
jgi:hypothetical protein